MASVEDVPRSLGFLLAHNSLNVAVSHAMCLAFVVASPQLVESRLIDALCRFVEMAAP
jgi:hypothetical protein